MLCACRRWLLVEDGPDWRLLNILPRISRNSQFNFAAIHVYVYAYVYTNFLLAGTLTKETLLRFVDYLVKC